MSRYTGTLDQPNATVTVDCPPGGLVEVLLAQPATTGATVIASGSDGVFLPQATINVANAATLASSGTVFIVTAPPGTPPPGTPPRIESVTYTGKTGTTLTGCAGGTGLLATGNAVTGNKLVLWVGVDRWLISGGNPPVLQTAANAVDHFVFENVGGVVHGRHRNEPGLAGAAGTPGAPGFQNRGTYAAGTAYVLNDIVTYLGATYISIQAGTGQTPASGSAYWDTVAATSGTRPPDPPPIIIIDPPLNTGDPTISLDQPGIAARLVERVGWQIAGYTDAQLAYLAQTLGMYGLWVQTYLSSSFGAAFDWSGTTPPPNSLQNDLTALKVVSRARGKGVGKLYLGFYTSNPLGGATMFGPGDWFNDAHWANTVIPAIKNFAGAAKLMGFDGLGFDGEEYPQNGGTKASWLWNYPGNTHTEAQVRAKVKQRGAEMMAAMLSQFPNVEIITYYAHFDGGFGALMQNVVNGAPLNNYSATQVMIDFWDGMTSVSGYARFRFQEDAFYRGVTDITGAGKDLRTCMTLDVNGKLAWLSQRLSNWAYANQRIAISPMSWLGPTNGDGPYTAANSNTAAQALTLVQAARIHGMSGEFADFSLEDPKTLMPPAAQNYADFTSTNGHLSHGNFVPAYAAAAPGIVDSTDPTLSGITITRDNATTVHAAGTANDNLGIRAIRWVSGPNSGAATHSFVIDGGGTYQTAYASFAWHVAWTANNIPATVGQTITFVVEDIKGRVALYTRVAP